MERLGGCIQKIITIPAALQSVSFLLLFVNIILSSSIDVYSYVSQGWIAFLTTKNTDFSLYIFPVINCI